MIKKKTKDFNLAYPIVLIIIKHQNSVSDGLFDEEYNNIDDSLVLLVIRNGNFDSFFKLIDKGLYFMSIKKDLLIKMVHISATCGYYEFTKLLFELIFNDRNPQYLQDPFQIIKLEDSVYFGSLSIFQTLYII